MLVVEHVKGLVRSEREIAGEKIVFKCYVLGFHRSVTRDHFAGLVYLFDYSFAFSEYEKISSRIFQYFIAAVSFQGIFMDASVAGTGGRNDIKYRRRCAVHKKNVVLRRKIDIGVV